MPLLTDLVGAVELDLGGLGHEVQRLLDSTRMDRPALVHEPLESQLHLRCAGEACSKAPAVVRKNAHP